VHQSRLIDGEPSAFLDEAAASVEVFIRFSAKDAPDAAASLEMPPKREIALQPPSVEALRPSAPEAAVR
jgi:hypothetical protein